MDAFMHWLENHWTWIAYPAGLILAGVIFVAALVGLRLLIAIAQRKLAVTSLDRLHHQRDQAKVRKEIGDHRGDDVRRDLQAAQAELASERNLRLSEQALLVALKENLASRDETIKRLSDQVSQEGKRARGLQEALSQARSVGAQVAQERDTLSEENASLTMTCTMLEKQVKGLESSQAMLQGTVTDLNAKRDLLTAELEAARERIKLLERLAQSQSST